MTIKHIQARFTSGNHIAIDKAMVPVTEWNAAMGEIEQLRKELESEKELRRIGDYIAQIEIRRLNGIIDAAGGGCELCTDPDGAACYPHYGVGPHTHAAGTWKSEPMPQDRWPINYREDAENPGHGVWWCPNCGCGKPNDAE